MSIGEKLGNMGIPGFRSGKKWKMLIASIGYFWILSFILIMILVPVPEEDSSAISANIPTTSTPVPEEDSSAMSASIPTTSAPAPRIQKYNMQDDIPPRSMINYTDLFETESDPMPDKITVYAEITANLGTMIEIVDKDDMGCLDVIDNVRGTKMPSGRYLFVINCSQQLDPESTVVTITNTDYTTPISYMLRLVVTEVIAETE